MTPRFFLAAGLVLLPALALAEAGASGDPRAAKTHFLRGLLLQRRGADPEALDAFEKAFAADPRSSFLCRQAAELALEAGLLDAAQRWVVRLESLDGSDPQTALLRGRLFWAQGQAEKAQAAFEAALKLNPKSAESILSLGSLLAVRDPDKARALFERLLRSDPERAADAHYQIALIEQKAGRLAEAVKHLKKSIELETGSSAARYALAQLYEVRHDTEAALSEYLGILRLEPHNVDLLNHLGEMYFVTGRLSEARERFSAAKTAAPGDPAACQWLSLIAEREGDYGRAADELAASPALASDPSLNLRLSYYLTQAGRLREAVALLEKAHERWPANEDLSYFLALGYDDLKTPAKAVALLRPVVAGKPEFRDARYQLAVLLEKTGKITEAEAEFREILARKPEDAGVLNYLGYSLADRGLKLNEALDLIKRAAALDPKNGAYQDSLGWAYFKLGRSTEAVRELESAAQKLALDPTIWEHLGDAYESAGREAAAWSAWKRAQALEGSGPRAAKKAARLQKAWDSESLGGLYMEHLAWVQGGVRKLSSLCEVEGSILGRSFRYSGVLTFRAPDQLDLDLLGPLFTPLLRARLRAEGFTMDPLSLEGVARETLDETLFQIFTLLREYLSGRVLSARSARYQAGWSEESLEAGGVRLVLDAESLRAVVVSTAASPDLRLELSEFAPQEGRQLPFLLAVKGKGFSFSLHLRKPKAEFRAP